MKTLNHFTLPIKGLKMGMHQFDFQVDSAFFSHFENSTIREGTFDVRLQFDKRADMFVLDFEFSGKVNTACDRCLANIHLPVNGTAQVMVKFAEAEQPTSRPGSSVDPMKAGWEENDIWYISKNQHELNVAKHVYEFITLALPLIKTYDCHNDEHAPCDSEMLKYLNTQTISQDESTSNPFVDALKNFKTKSADKGS